MEIHDLKQHFTILDIADRLGIQVNKQGKAHCPFHDDKTPSLQFSKEKNIATCFSSRCSAGTMDIIGLTEKYMKVNTHEAIMQLKEWAGYQPTNGQSKPKESDTLERIAILTKAFQYFENGVKTSRKSKEYLDGRGLVQTTPSRQGTEVGFNSGNFHNRANKNLQATALKYGLIYESIGNSGGYTAFAKDSLVFPLKNQDRKIVSLYFRLLDEKSTNRHFYLKDRQGLYPNYPRPETTKLILTEAIIDAATLLQLPGITNEYEILACYGTNGLTEEHTRAIQSLASLQEITFFFDGDPAGSAGVEKQSQKLKDLLPGVKLCQVETPENEDVNSLYVGHQDKAEELFKHLIKGRKLLTSTENKREVQEPEPKPETTPKPKAKNQEPKANFDASNPNKITYFTETAHYYVKGGLRQELDRLQVSLMIEASQQRNYGRYRNRLDLYENKQVERMAREAAEKLSLRADLVELDLYRLTDLLEDLRDKQTNDGSIKPKVILDNTVTGQCKDFLSKPNLIQRFNDLIGKAGVVGEENNRVFLFCIAASCGMPDTLHALIQGSSGSGKTHLLVKISNFIPDEDVKRFTRVTESSFYNYGMYDLKNKLICLEDLDGMKEEAQLAFRELQSREMLSSSTTGQDEKGNNRAYEKIVYGPIASMACTTKGEIYEDNMNRCFLIAVDETREQTGRIIQYQNRKASGKIDGQEERRITEFIQNCLRMLKPHEVINPYADKVQLPEEAHKIRRLNDLYQSFVKQMTLMNQYRRKKDQKGRLITEKEDLQVAAEIMFDSIVLKIDELDGSLRLFYEQLKTYIKGKGNAYESYSFGQREIRQALNISKTQLHRYINDLLSLEYIQQTGGYANRGYQYKVNWWDDIGAIRAKVKRHLQGQLDQLEIL
ncbi:CHC2 zinc finger domain-containing protein [uncultured Roseivirga sp.]|uniref:CHC2 zinc finger domain-containing protein n=1 Tax=uncultured Roseivirga sp. TaxID=543088 RepID=UPI0025956BA7|nr:CHC2 zinc finger domain-containing protein [uncultured Roseivirga sp.]